MAASAKTIEVEKAREALASSDALAIDVRDRDSWLEGHVPGALLIARDELESRLEEIPKQGRLIVVSDDASAAAEAAEALGERGFDAVALDGGMKAWKRAGFTLQPSEDPDLPDS
jgi:rhodanese-related sulfurtransferase